MSDELFNIKPSLSPREAWIKKHGIVETHDADKDPAYTAYCPKYATTACDTDRDKALARLARALATHYRVNPWNAPQT